jgi:hypothetical protein
VAEEAGGESQEAPKMAPIAVQPVNVPLIQEVNFDLNSDRGT